MTYYTEIRKSSVRIRKAKFWESDVIEKKNETRRIEKLKDEKDADGTVHKRATKKNYGDSIIFFLLAGGCANFHNFFCVN